MPIIGQNSHIYAIIISIGMHKEQRRLAIQKNANENGKGYQ